MEKLLYGLAVVLIAVIQKLPLLTVARLGRQAGALAFWLDGRHRRVALQNLTRCFAEEKPGGELRALAREHFRRLGENYCAAIKTAAMSRTELEPYLEIVGTEILPTSGGAQGIRNCIVAVGHFGNFELYARFGHFTPTFQGATTYRALKQPSLNRLLQKARSSSGCLFFERRTEAKALRTALTRGSLILGLLADQHAGRRGVSAPFFGRPCSTTPAPAILAIRYHSPLHTAICYRVALGHWRIEIGPAIATHENERPRSLESIMTDVNKVFESAVRRDPANWFWVHNRWKPFQPRSSGEERAHSLAGGEALPRA